MPRAALRPEDVEAFRARTIHAATRLFAEHGYAAVTLRAIARELGTSAMAPYRYFENKAEIFAMVRAEAYRRFGQAQEAAFQAEADPLARLFRMRDAYVRFALDHPDEYRVMFELSQEPAERYPELLAESERSFRVLEEAAAAAIRAGRLDGDPTTTAHLLWATLHGVVSLHLAGKLGMGRTLEALLGAPPLRFTP